MNRRGILRFLGLAPLALPTVFVSLAQEGDSGLDWSEGMAPGAVNERARAMMANLYRSMDKNGQDWTEMDGYRSPSGQPLAAARPVNGQLWTGLDNNGQ